VADVKAEVNRSMDMEDLKKMKETMDSAMTDVQQSVLNATTKLNQGVASLDMAGQAEDGYQPIIPYQWTPPPPSYQHPGKNWRIKRSATPQWYKSRHGVRTRALSGAARVARFRPPSGMGNH
jgi:sec-independent protein translocase protein TatB